MPAAQDRTACQIREDAHRAFHLYRITSQFTTTISPEGARRLARLLTADDNAKTRD